MKAILIRLLTLALLALPLRAQTIVTKTLDLGSGGTTGQYNSQAIVNGNPAIAYFNNTDSNLMFARNSAADGSGTWSIITVDNVGGVGQYTSLVVVNGNPAISYYDDTNGDLKYVRANDASGTSWGTPVTLDSTGDVGSYTSLAVVNGNPAISYRDNTNGDLKYVRANDASGTSWGAPVTVDSADYVGGYTSLAVINGNPAISYYDATNGDLKYVRALDASGTNWGTPVTLDSTGVVGSYTSLAVVNGNPAISYYDGNFFANRNLKYVRAADTSGTSWGAPVTVASIGSTTDPSSQRLSASLVMVNGNPAIGYWYYDENFSAGGVRYVRALDAGGAGWGTPVTLTSGFASSSLHASLSLAVVAGQPAISYWDSTSNLQLRYVRAQDASGTSWAAASTADPGFQSGYAGSFTSQAIVNGNPAISYYDSTNGDLKFVRALDAGGTSWGTPATLDSTGSVGQYTSLAVVNGNPAISYYDSTNGDLKYVRANDASGSSWSTPVTVASAGSVGSFTSLAVVNGNPAISYYDGTNGDLKYVRATDANGTSWATPVTLDSTGSVGSYTSLAVVNGNPAISYRDNTNGDLKYVRANDASGTSWGTPVTLDSTGNVGWGTSLAVVNGNPAISYSDGTTNYDLKYVRATNANGTSWGTPVTPDSAGIVGTYTSLAVVNGNPGISYLDNTNYDLKYVRANDASGTSWATPVTLDGTGYVGQYTSLLVVAGNAAISYEDASNGNLKWATYLVFVPEIAIEQPAGAGNNIPSGGSKGFGTVTVGNSADPVFTLKNTGSADLTLSGTPKVAVSGSGDFTVTAQPASPVAGPSGSTTFTVRFAPTSAGPLAATLSIANNDLDENPFTIALAGTGNLPPTLSPVTIASNNANPSWAKLGDTVTVSFTASEPIQTPAVTLLGVVATVANPSGNNWTASATVGAGTTQGTAIFSITATDLDGLAASAVTATTNASSVTVDRTAPVLSLPANITAEATSAAGRVVTYTASTTDNLDPSPSFSAAPASGSTFPIATTTVNVSSTDAAGNTANGSFTVTVQDTTAPSIGGTFSPLTLLASPGGTVALPNYTGQAVTGDSVGVTGVTQTPAPGSAQGAGITHVTLTASDAAGNSASTSFNVTVNDGTAPATPDAVPPLAISRTGGSVQLSWPATAVNWTLCACANLVAGDWVPVTTPAVVSGGLNIVTLPISGTAQFFQLRKRGAFVPFTTYEAEAAANTTNGTLVSMTTTPTSTTSTPELEASGRAFVELANAGAWLEFRNVRAANSMVLRHCIPDAPAGGGLTATLSLYVNGVFRQTLTLSSRHNWLYGHNPSTGTNGQANDPAAGTAHVFWDEARFFISGGMQAGDTLRLQRDAGDSAAFYRVDLIDLETAPGPLPPPAAGTYLSVTDFGANGNDALDDTTGIQSCITAAKAQGKIVWIPAGIYFQSANFTLDGVTARGAGMWHTQLVGTDIGTTFAGKIGFVLTGSGATVTDLAIDDDAHTLRSASPGGGKPFTRSGTCTGWRVENVWITHAMTGFWMSGVTNGVIRGCRVRDTYADAINLNSGTSSTLVEHCHVRGSGDDGLAILSESAAATVSTGNTLRFNTVIANWWGHNCDLAGGGGHFIEDNYLADNADVGSFTINLPGAFPMDPLTGAMVRRNTIVRGGGNLAGQKRGAIWIFPGSTTISGVFIRDNDIRDAIFRGIHLAGTQSQAITFERNVIDHPGENGVQILSTVIGTGVFNNNSVFNLNPTFVQFSNAATSPAYTVTLNGNTW